MRIALKLYPNLQGEVVKQLEPHEKDGVAGEGFENLKPIARYEVRWDDGYANTNVRTDRVVVVKGLGPKAN